MCRGRDGGGVGGVVAPAIVLPSSLLWYFGRYGWGAACRVVGLARRHDLHYVTIPISLPATPIVFTCSYVKFIPFMLLIKDAVQMRQFCS